MKRSSVVVMRKKNFGSHCLAVIPAGFLLFFVILFLGTRLFLRADVDPEHPVYKYYTEVRVGCQDTLWSIADRYSAGYESTEAFINDVRLINSLHGTHVEYGQYLTIPYYSEELR